MIYRRAKEAAKQSLPACELEGGNNLEDASEHLSQGPETQAFAESSEEAGSNARRNAAEPLAPETPSVEERLLPEPAAIGSPSQGAHSFDSKHAGNAEGDGEEAPEERDVHASAEEGKMPEIGALEPEGEPAAASHTAEKGSEGSRSPRLEDRPDATRAIGAASPASLEAASASKNSEIQPGRSPSAHSSGSSRYHAPAKEQDEGPRAEDARELPELPGSFHHAPAPSVHHGGGKVAQEAAYGSAAQKQKLQTATSNPPAARQSNDSYHSRLQTKPLPISQPRPNSAAPVPAEQQQFQAQASKRPRQPGQSPLACQQLCCYLHQTVMRQFARSLPVEWLLAVELPFLE